MAKVNFYCSKETTEAGSSFLEELYGRAVSINIEIEPFDETKPSLLTERLFSYMLRRQELCLWADDKTAELALALWDGPAGIDDPDFGRVPLSDLIKIVVDEIIEDFEENEGEEYAPKGIEGLKKLRDTVDAAIKGLESRFGAERLETLVRERE